LLVLFELTHFLLVRLLVHDAGFVELDLQGIDQIHVNACYLSVVILDLLVLRFMLLNQVFDGLVLLLLYLLDRFFAFGLHSLSKELHFVLVLQLNLVGDALVLLADRSRLLAVLLGERIQVLSLPHFLLFFGDF
jgi:hypothetical protein